MADSLRAAIIGLGSISKMHIASVMGSQYARLCAVCDTDGDKTDAAAAKYNVSGYRDYREMLDKEKPDVVHICTPHYRHTEMAAYAFNAGIHVLCEKPMSIGRREAEETIALAEERGLKYGIVFQCRYNDASRFVKKTLESGELGEILSARVVLTWNRSDAYYARSDWKGTWDKEGGGVIIDQAIHSLDLANWFIGAEPEWVYAGISNRGHEMIKVEDTGEGLIRYKNGIGLSFWAMNNYAADDKIEIRLFCRKGRVTLSYEDAEVILNNGEKRSVSQRQDDEAMNRAGGKEYWGFRHKVCIERFYESILGQSEPDISGREAFKVQNLICSIYESGKTGKKVYMDKAYGQEVGKTE